jgi:hypothetical protein
LPSGLHNVTLYAHHAGGNWVAPETVYYEIANHPSLLAESTSTIFLIIIISCAVGVAAGFSLLYFKKRKSKKL